MLRTPLVMKRCLYVQPGRRRASQVPPARHDISLNAACLGPRQLRCEGTKRTKARIELVNAGKRGFNDFDRREFAAFDESCQ
jgi:hypothetical protein